MSQPLLKANLHILFSTKDEQDYLIDENIRSELWSYMSKILQDMGCQPIVIGGTANHIHILCILSVKDCNSDIYDEIKLCSEKWLNAKGGSLSKFAWGSGCNVFSVSQSLLAKVKRYILNQEKIHRNLSYQDEYRNMIFNYMFELNK